MENKLKRIEPFSPEENPNSVLFHYARYRFAGRMLSKKDRVLDVGCGVGSGTHFLTEFCDMITGIDIDPEVIKKASSTYWKLPQLHFHVMDAQDIIKTSIPSFNVIVSIDNIEHLENPEYSVFHAYEILPVGGMFICGTPRKQDIPLRNSWHNHEFEADDFFELLETHFPRVFRFAMNEETVSVFNVNTCWYLWGIGIKL